MPSTMRALAPLLSLISAVLAVPGRVYCDPPDPQHRTLSTISCASATYQMPDSVRGIDFTVGHDGRIAPANAFTNRYPDNPHNLPQSYIWQECEIDVHLQAGTDVFLSTWHDVSRSADHVVDDCVQGRDGGLRGRGGNYTLDKLVIRVGVFERFYPRLARIG